MTGQERSFERSLEIIFEHLKALDPDAVADLRPGVGEDVLEALPREHGIVLPAEVRWLYRRYDGMEHWTAYTIYPGWEFPPLERALRDSDDYRWDVRDACEDDPAERSADQWLFLFGNMFGDRLACDCGEGSIRAPVYQYSMPGFDCAGPKPYTPSLSELLERWRAMYERGSIRTSNDGSLGRAGDVPPEWDWAPNVL